MAGRPESPLDPSAGPVALFAAELRKLRAEAGSPTYRVMGQRTGQGASTLSQAAAGDRLPTLPVVLAYVRACGGDEEEWEERWREAASQMAAEPRTEDENAEPPYRGLARFEPGDADLFFGRDQLTDRVLELSRSRRFSAVFGSSGSGKSSLLRAGLIPRLRTPGPAVPRPASIRVLTPGEHPLRTHTERLMPAGGDGETWLIVDQFEEVYTLCTDPCERDQFIDQLLACTDTASRLRVVIAVRADFLGRCAEHPQLTAALQEGAVLIGPMSRAELREAIVKPAQAAGLIVERGLTTRILNEVEGESGALPLMSHALLETWRRRKGRALTEAAYEAAGGLHGAISRTAEAVYARLTPTQADAGRRILLRLITPGDGTSDTRRPTDRTELDLGDPADTNTVLEHLTDARLLTLDEDTVDVAHEALVTAWPRLRAWIDTERDRLRIHRQLTDAARTWHSLDRDSSVLYRGTRLAAVEDAFPEPDRHRDLTAPEAAFLAASIREREHERLSAVRSAKRLRTLVGSLTIVVALALIASLIAWQQNRTSEQRAVEAEARRIASVANNMRSTDPVRAMRLSLAAWALSHTTETRSSLLAAWAQKEQDRFTIPGAGSDSGYELTPDGQVLVTENDEGVTKWDLVSHRKAWSLREPGATLGGVTPDGRTVAVDGRSGPELWDTTTSRRQWAPRERGPITAAFGSSGDTLVTWSGTSDDVMSVALWNRRTHHLLFRHAMKTEGEVPGALTSAGDRLVALCPGNASPEVWEVAGGRKLRVPAFIGRLRDPCSTNDLQFAPRGQLLAAATGSGVRTWDFSARKEMPSLSQADATGIQFSRDGRFLAAVSDSTVELWRITAPDAPVFRYTAVNEDVNNVRIDIGAQVLRYVGGAGMEQPTVIRTLGLGHVIDPAWADSEVDSARFSPDGRTLGTVQQNGEGGSGRLRLLNASSGRVTAELPVPCRHAEGCSGSMAFSGDGRLLAYAPTGGDTARALPVTLWDSRARRRSTRDLTPSDKDRGGPSDLALSPNGRYLLVSWDQSSDASGAVDIWATGGRKEARVLSGADGLLAVSRDGLLATSDGHFTEIPVGQAEQVNLSEDNASALAFSDDGKHLAAADNSGRVYLWDMADRQRTGILVGVFGSAPEAQGDGYESVSALAFSHDGSTLAVGGDQGTLQLWDVASNQRLGSPFPTRGDIIQSLAFSPSDDTVYAAGSHVPLQKYPVASETIVAAVCARADGGLSQADWKAYIPDQPNREVCS